MRACVPQRCARLLPSRFSKLRVLCSTCTSIIIADVILFICVYVSPVRLLGDTVPVNLKCYLRVVRAETE